MEGELSVVRVTGLFFALVVLSILPMQISAKDYYVAVGGSNDNPGTLAAPWKTISKAADLLQPGI